jgi:hypothetical protein
MKEKKRYLFKLMMISIIAFAFLFSMVAIATADSGEAYGTEESPAIMTIRKDVKYSVGNKTPLPATFSFYVSKISLDGDVTATADMPDVGPIEIAFPATTSSTTDAGVITHTLFSENIFDGIDFPKPGVYVYDIGEDNSVPAVLGDGWDLKHSVSQYLVKVYVEPGVSGNYIAAIIVILNVDDNNNQVINRVEKADPLFINRFQRKSDGNLQISKRVQGLSADYNKYFKFTITINKPSIYFYPNAKNDIGYPTAYLFDGMTTGYQSTIPAANADPSIVELENFGAGPREVIMFKYGVPTTVYLRHGQRLEFDWLWIGTTVQVKEEGTADYTASYEYQLAGDDEITATGTIGTDLSTPWITIKEPAPHEGNIINANRIRFINTKRPDTPTGIAIDNLPFIGILGLVGASLGGFITIKAHKRSKFMK